MEKERFGSWNLRKRVHGFESIYIHGSIRAMVHILPYTSGSQLLRVRCLFASPWLAEQRASSEETLNPAVHIAECRVRGCIRSVAVNLNIIETIKIWWSCVSWPVWPTLFPLPRLLLATFYNEITTLQKHLVYSNSQRRLKPESVTVSLNMGGRWVRTIDCLCMENYQRIQRRFISLALSRQSHGFNPGMTIRPDCLIQCYEQPLNLQEVGIVLCNLKTTSCGKFCPSATFSIACKTSIENINRRGVQ